MPNVEVELSNRDFVYPQAHIYANMGSHKTSGSFTFLNGHAADSLTDLTSSCFSSRLMAGDCIYATTNGHSHQTNGHSIPNGRPKNLLICDEDYSDLESEVSTLSSSPTISLIEEKFKFDEVLLQEKFEKLGLGKYLEDLPRSGKEESSEESEDEEGRNCKGPLIRSTSLRTGKTPPNTPARKKFVRFADSLGLELALVRNIFTDELPLVPQSAYNDLKWDPPMMEKKFKYNSPSKNYAWMNQCQNTSTLIPEFVQPCVLSNFLTRVRQQKVCLENCTISSGSGSLTVTCVIRVLNVSFEKLVMVRYSLTEWQSWTTKDATYIPSSSDGWSDKFTVSFSVNSGDAIMPGQRILFAIRYLTNHEEVWDNNMGLNYSLIYRV